MEQPSEDKNTLSRVRRIFLSMASPFGFGSDSSLFKSLVTVNLPPVMGRCEAAFEQSLKIVEDGAVFDMGDEVRVQYYRLMHDLFARAKECSAALSLLKSKGGKLASFDDLAAAYSFLEWQSRVLCDYLQSQITVMNEPGSFFAEYSRRIDSVAVDPEVEIFHQLKDFLFDRKNNIQQLHNEFKKLLSAQELDRYSKAYSEYSRYYSRMISADHFTQKDVSPAS